ncbi:hypothetical protein HPP92_007229 [Vanilla planifolia]|uniref:Small ribosomal subunit protein uS8c n=1 Tax=Vanilla planifolia TaxID=51239 RepID=A0A835RLI5_VANPL|nr:hypothetical protein HPP92_007229 [Vanilla planifolia]
MPTSNWMLYALSCRVSVRGGSPRKPSENLILCFAYLSRSQVQYRSNLSSSSTGFHSGIIGRRNRMGRMILNNALRTIVNAERRGKATAKLQPISTTMASFLSIMKQRGYIKDFQVHDPHRVGKITVELQGRIKDAKALTYRQDIKAKDIEEYRIRTLPTRQVILTAYELVLISLCKLILPGV